MYTQHSRYGVITYIEHSDLEQIARRVWYGKKDKADRLQDQKRSSFKQMGLEGMSTEFPMRSGEWTPAGNDLEMMVSYPKWDIPALIWVRKTQQVESVEEE